jgi:FMN phosphatase YigB (HAD superfamily)
VIGVAFSLSGTLGSDNGLYRAAIERLVSDLYHERSEAPDGRLIEAIVQNLPPAIGRPGDGRLAMIDALFPQTKAEPSLEARFRIIARDLVQHHFQPYGDALNVLAELKELRVPHAILSDGWSAVEQQKAAMLNFRGSVIVGEHLEGRTDGRSLAAFAAASGALQLPADRVWFVGRDPRRDIALAHAAGFRTVWLNRSGRAYPAGLPKPDHTIARLDALLHVIGRPYMRAAMIMSGLLDTRFSEGLLG